MIRNLLAVLLFSTSLTAQNKFRVIMPEQDPNYISLGKIQMLVIQSTYDKDAEATIEVKVSEKNKPLIIAELKNVKLMNGHNTINLDPAYRVIDKKKGEILRRGNKLEEGDYVISAHVSVLYEGVISFSKDSFICSFPSRGNINTLVPNDQFEFEETPNIFMWEPINPVIQDAMFKLSIYELKDKEKPEDAVAKGHPVFINMVNFSNQINVIGKGEIPFKRNKTYCWIVTMDIGEFEMKRSAIKTFKVKSMNMEHDHEPQEPVLIHLNEPIPPKKKK